MKPVLFLTRRIPEPAIKMLEEKFTLKINPYNLALTHQEIIEGIEESKLSINFGKNGYGLTDELITIGKRVKELSKYNLVYLSDSFIDTLDDVYQLTFILAKKP